MKWLVLKSMKIHFTKLRGHLAQKSRPNTHTFRVSVVKMHSDQLGERFCKIFQLAQNEVEGGGQLGDPEGLD